MKKHVNPLLLLGAILAGMQSLPSSVSAQVLYSDNFQTNSASAWTVFGASSRSGGTVTNDYKAIFSTNYTSIAYQPGQFIPPSPRSTEGTNSRGLYVTANHSVVSTGTNASIAAMSAFPTGKSFTGNYSLRFDMWMNYNGGAGGGSGSTEMATFGVNHSGSKINWYSGHPNFVPANWTSDGQWFWVAGEGGTGGSTPAAGSTTSTGHADMEAFVGNPTGAATALGSGGGFLYPQGVDWEDPLAEMSKILPVPPGESWGAPGKQWVTVEVRSQGGYVTWLMNGFVIASHNTLNDFTSGNIMVGYCDGLRGTPPAADWPYCFTLYDNLQVVDLGASETTPTVTIAATQTTATKPGSGPSDWGVLTITRQDRDGNPISPATPLTVNLVISGTASNGVDYTLIPTNIVIPAGSSSTNLNIKPTSIIGDPTTTVDIRLAGSFDYELRTSFKDTITINDSRGVPGVTVETYKSVAYGTYRPGVFNLVAAATYPTNVTINFALTGTATSGTDYTAVGGTATLEAGSTNVLVTIAPTSNSMISNKTVILTVNDGNGYRVGTVSNATMTLRTPAVTAGTQQFIDEFESDSSANWNISKSESTDVVTFDYDYSAVDGIPSAPGSTNTTTKGVKLQANFNAGTRAGLSLSPKGKNFTGDYRLRFDFWLNYYGNTATGIGVSGSGATMWFGGGVGTTGVRTNWDNGQADGIWIDFNNDGSSTVSADFEAFRGATDMPVDVFVGNSQSHFSPYYAEFGLETAPQVQQSGAYALEQSGVSPRGTMAFRWHDFTAVKQGTNVTFYIDNLPIAQIPTNGITLSSNVFITYYSPGNVSPLYSDVSFALIDNVRVDSLTTTPPTTPSITGIQVSGGNVQINFTGGTADAPSAFTVQSKAVVTDAFADDATATAGVAQNGPAGSFRATFPVSGTTKFYRIKR